MSSYWYKDAIIYETHVRAFFDSTGDGVGDFPGLIQKLDYLQDLGINCLWLLPFYPSPLRDDGYDIASYKGIHPMYGTMRDFRNFVRESHRRGIRVVTELVINHTSDQHPWFQVARNSPSGSARRNRYVWNDHDQKYNDARIIFTDSEKSNWSWDPVAKAYYWHRFFHHQPDLNFQNPAVLREMIKVLRFWLDQGVDGLRLDAVPYLMERESTDCENLPETHAILKQIRKEVDLNYADRMLLGEANQWPSDVRPYFGDGDECHMAYHFPLMPRIFMALRQEDRHPITDILRQTPAIPDSCQWALFLRNHDELTLEMVTDEERDYMYHAYAADPRMRINIGIRRRLAPLMDNSRRRIELLTSLLFSLRGTPVIYYGDEIGMGDNIYLGDRNGVRTPMQWSSDRNAGFSRADFAQLYSPPIMDSIYGYQAINVEAQQRDPSSLLHWMRRMIALRNRLQVFGRGTMEFLLPSNRKILAYIRKYQDDVILCVANLSRFVQPVELDLSEYAGLTPVEMMGRIEFPRITESPYFVSMGPHTFYWFQLQRVPETISLKVIAPPAEAAEEVLTVELEERWESVMKRKISTPEATDILKPFLKRQRWWAGKSRVVKSLQSEDRIFLTTARTVTLLELVRAEYKTGAPDLYAVPMAVVSPKQPVSKDKLIARIHAADGEGLLIDAMADDVVCQALLLAVGDRLKVKSENGIFTAIPTPLYESEIALLRTPVKINRLMGEQSNTSVLFGDRVILKLFRRLENGINPEYEILKYLTETGSFERAPKLVGHLEYRPTNREAMTIGIFQTFIGNQGDAWNLMLNELSRFFERAERAQSRAFPSYESGESFWSLMTLIPPENILDLLGMVADEIPLLGRRTAELHLALAQAAGPEMAPEPMTVQDFLNLSHHFISHQDQVHELLQSSTLSEQLESGAERLNHFRPNIARHFGDIGSLKTTVLKTRIHGDFHLGQVLWSKNDFYIVDFEGEPSRSLSQRRRKQPPLKDVAGMLRSFSYAAHAALLNWGTSNPQNLDRMRPWAKLWTDWVSALFLKEYLANAVHSGIVPGNQQELRLLLSAFMLDKALYEIVYEMNHRPDWISIPLSGIEDLLQNDPHEQKMESASRSNSG